MNKQEFLKEVREKLNDLPENDINKSLDYYEEMIQDRMEEGLSEEEAVEALGSMEDIVSQILSEVSPQQSEENPEKVEEVKEPTNPSQKKFGALQITLIILGFPLWFPLIVAAFSIILSLYIVVWSVLISLYAADLAIGVSAIAAIAGTAMLLVSGEYAQAVCSFGTFLMCAGLSILMFLALLEISKGTVFLSKRAIELCLSRKGKVK